MRGASSDWRGCLRDYNYKDNVLLKRQGSKSPNKDLGKDSNQIMMTGQFPVFKEKEVQTIKSIFKPMLVDEQLSAISHFD